MGPATGTAWPADSDYYDAVQNPKPSFTDPVLSKGTAKQDGMGGLWMDGGVFALVFQVSSGKQTFAVRCFKTKVNDRATRYQQIGSHLKLANNPIFCHVDYQPRGIKVRGDFYPILKMEWAHGVPLDAYVRDHLGKPQALRALRQELLSLVDTLKANGVAHGDLQHRNILVTPQGRMRLVDYDGMYVPGIEQKCGPLCPEGGHPNFQHPRRTARDYALGLDNFSSLVLYLSLWAVEAQPALWDKFNTGDNLIFLRKDFEGPNSDLMNALRACPDKEVAQMAWRLQAECRRSAALAVSELRLVLDGKAPPVGTAPTELWSGGGSWANDEAATSTPAASTTKTASASPQTGAQQWQPADDEDPWANWSGSAAAGSSQPTPQVPPTAPQPTLRLTDADGLPVTKLRLPGVRKGRSVSARFSLGVRNDGKSPREIEVRSNAEWLKPLASPKLTMGAGESRFIQFDVVLTGKLAPNAAVFVGSGSWYDDDVAFSQTVEVEIEVPPARIGVWILVAIVAGLIGVFAIAMTSGAFEHKDSQDKSRDHSTNPNGNRNQARDPVPPERPLIDSSWTFQKWNVLLRTREGASLPEQCLVFTYPLSTDGGEADTERALVLSLAPTTLKPSIWAQGPYSGHTTLAGHGRSFTFVETDSPAALDQDVDALIALFVDGLEATLSADSAGGGRTADVYSLVGFTNSYNFARSRCR